MDKDQITELFDKQGNLIGALLTTQAWTEAKPLLKGLLSKEDQTTDKPEPLKDWETLKNHWDYPYPVDMDVLCSNCNASTKNWAKDTPRLFRLTAAGLAGLVTFRCLACNSKIIKKHFKDEILVENHPPREKDKQKEARY